MTPQFTVCLHHNITSALWRNQTKGSWVYTSLWVPENKWREVHSAACLPILGMGNPSIAPNREEKGMLRRKTHSSKTVKSKHMFKSNNRVTAAGNGKTRDQQWSGSGQQTHRLGYKVETEIEGGWGSRWFHFSKSIWCGIWTQAISSKEWKKKNL